MLKSLLPRSPLLLLILAPFSACGGRSELDDYADGIPDVVPLTSGQGAPADEDGDAAGDGDAGSAEPDAGDPGEPGLAVGDACDEPAQCGGDDAQCLMQIEVFGGAFSIDFMGGYCTHTCSDDGDCPDGSGCFTAMGNQACLKLCEDDTECRTEEDYSCSAIPVGGDQRTYCMPSFGGFGGFGGGG